MERTTLLRILRIASALFINAATGYLGVSIFAPVFVPEISSAVVIKNLVLGISSLFCAYICEKALDES
jgi:hypothetical protein